MSVAPPHNLEAEQAVLGAVLLSSSALPGLLEDGLRSRHFYRERHKVVFDAMLALNAENEPVELLTLIRSLETVGKLEAAGGRDAIDALAGDVPAAGNARHYGRIVRDDALDRDLLELTYAAQAAIARRAGSARDRADQLVERGLALAAQRQIGEEITAAEAIYEEIDRLSKLADQPSDITGVPSGLRELDEITAGFQPGNLIVIGARPAVGKSAVMTNIAAHAAVRASIPTWVVSAEMTKSELAQRWIAAEGRIHGDRLRRGQLKEQHYDRVGEVHRRFAAAPLSMWNTSEARLIDLRGKARRWRRQHPDGLGMIVVDYLQLVRAERTGRDMTRVEEVSEVSRQLKAMARELDVAVIALSQLNRGVEQRHDKRPMLSDLRESGQVEQDADLVVFLYREDYYDEEERPNELDLIVAKHRNGRLGEATVLFLREFQRVRDLPVEAHRDDAGHLHAVSGTFTGAGA